MKKSTLIFVIILLIVIGGLLIVYNKPKKHYINKGEITCKEACIKSGYPKGECYQGVTFQSPEDRCKEEGKIFLSGKHKDCYEQLIEITGGEPMEGISVICCCK